MVVKGESPFMQCAMARAGMSDTRDRTGTPVIVSGHDGFTEQNKKEAIKSEYKYFLNPKEYSFSLAIRDPYFNKLHVLQPTATSTTS